jgi:ribosomal peptide maturation radical SAM protein 1
VSRVAIVVMPFWAEDGPALGPALLQAALRKRGIECRVHHLNLRFAARLGLARYRAIDRMTSLLMGEWLFAPALFPEGLPPAEEFARDVLHEGDGGVTDELEPLRTEATAFVEECRRAIPWGAYDAVGFASSFQQNTASLALAARLRADHPRLRIALGGANAEGDMGEALIESFPFLDAVASGEADESFPRLVEEWAAGRDGRGIPGILTRGEDGRAHGSSAPPVSRMDDLPSASFEDYFVDLAASGLDLAPSATHLRYETARGCWWGEKAHCTFCGLNGGTMGFRTKSNARVLEELEALAGYPTRSVLVTDNILGRAAIDELLPRLAERKLGLRLFFETKSPIPRAEMDLLERAGVRRIQPGIESLSTMTLGRMRKGTRAIENVALLKWANEHGIAVTWNLLCGFPRERDEEHEAMTELLPSLEHLQPPTGLYEVQVHRFAPFHRDPEGLGIGPIRPLAAYRHIYPFADDRLRKIAYYFERCEPIRRTKALAQLAGAVTRWKGAAGSGHAAYLIGDDGDTVTALDARPGRAAELTRWTGDDRRIILACDAPKRLAELRAALDDDSSPDELSRHVDALARAGMLLSLDERWITLPERWEISKNAEDDLRAGVQVAGRRLAALSVEGAGT